MNRLSFLRFTCPLFFIVHTAFGQLSPSDSSFLQKSIQQVYALYEQRMNVHSHLYNGGEYVDYDNFFKGHQYFETDDIEEGTIFYDGTLYPNVPLLYDIRLDEVITENYAGPYRIRLVGEKVAYFTLLDHTFVRMVADSSQTSSFRTGFYDQLYGGNSRVLAKRTKLIQEKIVSGEIKREFIQKNRYFIQHAGKLMPVKSKKSVLNVFDDQRQELQKFLRTQKIKFKRDPENAMVQLARRYDALANLL